MSSVETGRDPTAEDAQLAAWVERTVRGRVTRVERMPRWRPAWDIDVDVDGRALPLHARGDREPRIVMPYRIGDEVADPRPARGARAPGAPCVRPLRRPVRPGDGPARRLRRPLVRGGRRRARPAPRRVPGAAGADLRDPARRGRGRGLRGPDRRCHHRSRVPAEDGSRVRRGDGGSARGSHRGVPAPLAGGERPTAPPRRGALHHLRLVPVHVRGRSHHGSARFRARACGRPHDGPRGVADPRHAQEHR